MAMPRKEVPYEKTWIYLLKQHFASYDIIDRSARGTTSFRLISEGGFGVDLLESYNPDVVILQLGITECSPRLFKKKGLEFFLMNKLLSFSLRQKYIKFIKRKRVRDPELTDITPSIFKSNISNYVQRAKKNGTIVLAILINDATDLFISKSPHIQKNIDRYNEIYKTFADEYQNVKIISPFKENVNINDYSVDELHIDIKGNDLLSKKIISELNKI